VITKPCDRPTDQGSAWCGHRDCWSRAIVRLGSIPNCSYGSWSHESCRAGLTTRRKVDWCLTWNPWIPILSWPMPEFLQE